MFHNFSTKTSPEGFQLSTVWDSVEIPLCVEAILGEALLEELLKKALVGGVVKRGNGD